MRHLVAEGLARAVPAHVLLDGTSLRLADLDFPSLTVPAWEEAAVAANLAASTAGAPSVGVSTGRRQHISTFGHAGLAMMSSPDVLAAFRFAQEFSPLLPALSSSIWTMAGDRAILELDGDHLPRAARPLIVERDLSAIAQCTRELTASGTIRIVRIEVDFDAVADALWVEHFGVPPVHGDSTRCVIETTHLADPLPQADPDVLALARSECERLMGERRASLTVSAQVRARLHRAAPDLPSPASVARDLLTTERTLRRGLRREGTTFRHLADEVRLALAREKLDSGTLSVEQIAHRMGYGDSSAFTHAFRRWSGTTPRGYRQNQRRDAPSTGAVST